MAITDNLVSYWKLDETSGTRADAHASNNLTDNNTVTYGTGIINNGASFASATSEYLSIADASQSGLDLSGDCSFSFWFNIASIGSSVNMPIINKHGFTGTTRGYSVYLVSESGTRKIRMNISNAAGTSYEIKYVTYSWPLGSLAHCVCIFDATAKTFEVYINGTSVGTSAAFSNGAIYNNSQPFEIGTADAGVDGYLNGILDEVGVWSRKLTSAEVTSLYNSGSGLAYPFSTATEISVSDQINLTESVTMQLASAISVSDQLNITESATVLVTLLVISVSDQLNITESVTNSGQLYVSVGDNITITESVGMDAGAYSINVYDEVNISESTSALINPLIVSVYDQLNITDTASLEGAQPRVGLSFMRSKEQEYPLSMDDVSIR